MYRQRITSFPACALAVFGVLSLVDAQAWDHLELYDQGYSSYQNMQYDIALRQLSTFQSLNSDQLAAAHSREVIEFRATLQAAINDARYNLQQRSNMRMTQQSEGNPRGDEVSQVSPPRIRLPVEPPAIAVPSPTPNEANVRPTTPSMPRHHAKEESEPSTTPSAMPRHHAKEKPEPSAPPSATPKHHAKEKSEPN
jgi:hypothetical protein